MNIIEIIAKKRDKKELTKEEIEYFITRIYKWRDCRLSSVCTHYGDIFKWNEL